MKPTFRGWCLLSVICRRRAENAYTCCSYRQSSRIKPPRLRVERMCSVGGSTKFERRLPCALPSSRAAPSPPPPPCGDRRHPTPSTPPLPSVASPTRQQLSTGRGGGPSSVPRG